MARLRGGVRTADQHDKTGFVLGDRSGDLFPFPHQVVLVRYGSLAHTLWRAQEFTLFQRHRNWLDHPRADFGCGDGSFGSALFSEIDVGVDNDPEALAACARQTAYRTRVLATPEGLPLPTGSLSSVFANSVLEHTTDPNRWISEMARILKPGGVVIATVPLMGFARHLERYFGSGQSRRINQAYRHHSLFEREEWVSRFHAAGFKTEIQIGYQGAHFTFWYRFLRLLGERGLGLVPGLQESFWRFFQGRWVNMVRDSVAGAPDPANLFFVGRRA